jgi:hypothetical protein
MTNRPRQVGKASIPTRWRGEFGAYAVFESGLRVPHSGKVQWELPEGPFVYWEGEVTGVSPS